jgi:hypothetical protein
MCFCRIGQKALEPDPEIAMAIVSCVHHFHMAALQMVRELLSKNTSLEDWIIASATTTDVSTALNQTRQKEPKV